MRLYGVNKLVVNKMDILDQVGRWCVYSGIHVLEFESREDIEFWLSSKLKTETNENLEIFFSSNKEKI